MTNHPFPKLDLTTFFLSVSSAALMGLGLHSPDGEEARIDLDFAKHNIELLELMLDKTKGNRTPEEGELLEKLLFEVRMRFVEVSRAQGAKQ